uniref:Uncharacterized protein n=1 Tax=Avena sativa TaxID=4498 RepID=A0ACD6A0P8_AVESA
MATPPAQPTEIGAADSTTVDSLKDDNIEDILLQLLSPASLARAALSSRRWRRVASSPDFLRRFRERHPSPPVLGLFVSQTDLGQLPVFHPSASVRSDPDLAAAARGGDFLLTRLEHDPAWRLRDCRSGRLLLCRGESLSVYDPISHRHVAVRRPPTEPLPPSGTEYIADCLLVAGAGHGVDGAASFRVVSVQRDGPRLRAMEYRSGTPDWRCHPWVDDIDVATLSSPAMPAAAAGLIFWRLDQNSSLLLDTSTMTFSTVPLPAPLLSTQPIRPRPVYGIGDTEEGECCLVVMTGRNTLQVWLLKENDTGNMWELERQSQITELPGFTRRFGFYIVVAGQAIVYCMGTKYSHFVTDLKNLMLKDKFLCHRAMAYPFQMTWPPAGLVATSTCERSTPQTYGCRDGGKQREASSSSTKRKSMEEPSCGTETNEPCISTAPFKNESSEKKFCYEPRPHLD